MRARLYTRSEETEGCTCTHKHTIVVKELLYYRNLYICTVKPKLQGIRILCSIAEQAKEHVAQLLRSSDEQQSRCRKMDVGGSEMLGRRGRNEGGREEGKKRGRD